MCSCCVTGAHSCCVAGARSCCGAGARRRFVLGLWVVTFVLVILGVVVFSSGPGYDGGGGGLCM